MPKKTANRTHKKAANLIEGMGLFGLQYASRNFENPDCWKKNIFNNAFPASLVCWMAEHGYNPVYLTLEDTLRVAKEEITAEVLFGLRQLSPNLFYKFEDSFGPYSILLEDQVPRTDLVTYNSDTGDALRHLEIKLTALPDNTTISLTEEQYGSEIVVRPDSIIYLALSIAKIYQGQRDVLYDMLEPACDPIGDALSDWQTQETVLPCVSNMIAALNNLMLGKLEQQQPIVLQPIWKTQGQRLILAEQCFDAFVWSNFAFTRLFMGRAVNLNKIERPERSVIWLAKMLYDFARNNNFNARETINGLTYGPKNDKAFSVTGKVTQPLMACPQLANPRIHKETVCEIILGGGQDYLQPERRLDAALLTTPGLFLPRPIKSVETLPAILNESTEEDMETEGEE